MHRFSTPPEHSVRLIKRVNGKSEVMLLPLAIALVDPAKFSFLFSAAVI
jgi:hypothetical protein